MGAVGAVNPTILDVAKRTEGPSGKISKNIIEILSMQNEILDDATWIECNQGASHKTTIRSGLPTPTWRQLNYGVQPTKSTTVQVLDSCGMLEDYAEIDKALAELNGNTADWRLSEDLPHIEGMNQSFCSTLFYGNTAINPERFMGLAPRYNALTGSPETKDNVLSAGGAGSVNTSVWFVVWGPNTAHCLYPNGSPAGVQMQDLGEQTILDPANNNARYQGYRTHYKWDSGFTVRDWRYIVRIANIDSTLMTKDAATGPDLCDLLAQAMEIVPHLNMGRAVFYANRNVKSYLRRQMVNHKNVLLDMQDVGGKHVMTFSGFPVRRCDSLLNTEATVA